jgi:hypothetical protein
LGGVERLFSQSSTISKRQHTLDDNVRRLRFGGAFFWWSVEIKFSYDLGLGVGYANLL